MKEKCRTIIADSNISLPKQILRGIDDGVGNLEIITSAGVFSSSHNLDLLVKEQND